MKLLTVAILTIFFCGCTQPSVKPVDSSVANSDAVKDMANKAIKICGQGNVQSVTVNDFKCFK